MTEAWKSVPKKFCEICKCWFYDNKVSVQHHEQGRRHQESVKKKLREIGKKGREREHEERATQIALAQMERGALSAYKRDVKDGAHAAAAYNIHMNVAALPMPAAPPSTKRQRIEDNKIFEEFFQACASSAPPAWYEARTLAEDGDTVTYFWNTQTGETVWELPQEVTYVSWSEQEASAGTSSVANTGPTVESVKQDPQAVQDSGKGHCTEEASPDISGNRAIRKSDGISARKKTKNEDIVAKLIERVGVNIVVEKSTAAKEEGEREIESPQMTKVIPKETTIDRNPYGEWQPVEFEERKNEFCYLPQNKWMKEESTESAETLSDVCLDDDDDDVKKIKFGERTAPTLGSAHGSGPCAFKKRKTAGGRTARKRDD